MTIEDIEDIKTKVRSPQTDRIFERFRKTNLKEFYRVAFRKKVHTSLEPSRMTR